MTDINGVPIIKPETPCVPWPEDASYKTVGLGPCPRCGVTNCWRRYLSWEKSRGITINADRHPEQVDEDHERKASTAIIEIAVELGGGQNIVEMKVKAPGIVHAATFWIQEPKVIAARARGVAKIAQPLLYVECDSDGELQDRVFMFQPSGAQFRPSAGFAQKYLTTIVGQHAMHVFEIVQAPS